MPIDIFDPARGTVTEYAGTFISYAHQDSPFAERLARDLRRESVPVWFDQWELGCPDETTAQSTAPIQPSEVELRWPELDSRLLATLRVAMSNCEALVIIETTNRRARIRKLEGMDLMRVPQSSIPPGRDAYLAYESFIWVETARASSSFKRVELDWHPGESIPLTIERGALYRLELVDECRRNVFTFRCDMHDPPRGYCAAYEYPAGCELRISFSNYEEGLKQLLIELQKT